MSRISIPTIAILGFMAMGGLALAAQDKYTVKVPDGLAFSEFKGFENWRTVPVSQPRIGYDKLIEVILGNPAMIAAYRAGNVGDRKLVPDGARMARIHWDATHAPAAPT